LLNLVILNPIIVTKHIMINGLIDFSMQLVRFDIVDVMKHNIYYN